MLFNLFSDVWGTFSPPYFYLFRNIFLSDREMVLCKSSKGGKKVCCVKCQLRVNFINTTITSSRVRASIFFALCFFREKAKNRSFFSRKNARNAKNAKKNYYFQKWELYAIRTPLAMAIFMLAQAHVTDPLATLLKISLISY